MVIVRMEGLFVNREQEGFSGSCHSSGGPIFSAFPEKMGEKGGAGCVWRILRFDLGKDQFESLRIRIRSQYGRYGTRRPLMCASDLFARAFEWGAVNRKCYQNQQNGTHLH